MRDQPEVSTVDAECEKDGKIMRGIFQLRFVDGMPWAVYDAQEIGGQQFAKMLSLNPEWLKRVDAPTHQYEYTGRIQFPKTGAN